MSLITTLVCEYVFLGFSHRMAPLLNGDTSKIKIAKINQPSLFKNVFCREWINWGFFNFRLLILSPLFVYSAKLLQVPLKGLEEGIDQDKFRDINYSEYEGLTREQSGSRLFTPFRPG